jgi:hypothetical protein
MSYTGMDPIGAEDSGAFLESFDNPPTAIVTNERIPARGDVAVPEMGVAKQPPTTKVTVCTMSTSTEPSSLSPGIPSPASRTDSGGMPATPSALEDIAICGVALRLPGGIHDTEAFWDMLLSGADARTEIPQSRFNAAGFSKAMGSKGAFDTQHGYFLQDDLACLDTSFFSVRKSELETMDPQNRQLLEVTRECLENAGETDYRGKRIGCYVGTFGDDWLLLQSKSGLQSTAANRLTFDLFLANRVSYEFDLRGPR